MEKLTESRYLTINKGLAAEYKVKMVVECDVTGLTEDQVHAYAFDAIWIREQTKLRKFNQRQLDELQK